jgi:hypothetical protein
VIEERTEKSITLEWQVPVNNGGDDNLSYNLDRMTDKNSTVGIINVVTGLEKTEYTISPLSPGQEYIYIVSAHNSVKEDNQAYSEALVVTFIVNPSPPTQLKEEVELKDS